MNYKIVISSKYFLQYWLGCCLLFNNFMNIHLKLLSFELNLLVFKYLHSLTSSLLMSLNFSKVFEYHLVWTSFLLTSQPVCSRYLTKYILAIFKIACWNWKLESLHKVVSAMAGTTTNTLPILSAPTVCILVVVTRLHPTYYHIVGTVIYPAIPRLVKSPVLERFSHYLVLLIFLIISCDVLSHISHTYRFSLKFITLFFFSTKYHPIFWFVL